LPMHPSIHGLGFVLCESTHNSLTDELLHADQKHRYISGRDHPCVTDEHIAADQTT